MGDPISMKSQFLLLFHIFLQNRIFNVDFNILTRGGTGDPNLREKNQYLLSFSSGAYIKMYSYINFHENRTINKINIFKCIEFQMGGKGPIFDFPIFLKMESRKTITLVASQ